MSFKEWVLKPAITSASALIVTTFGIAAIGILWKGTKAAIEWTNAVTPLPHWAIVLWGLITAILLGAIGLRAWYAWRTPATERSYDGDVVFGFRWHWLQFGSDVLDPKMFCPKCYNALDQANQEEKYESNGKLIVMVTCSRCDHSAVVPRVWSLADVAKEEAERRLRTGEWIGWTARLKNPPKPSGSY